MIRFILLFVLNLTVLNFLVLIVPCAHHSCAYRFRAHRRVLIVSRAYSSPISDWHKTSQLQLRLISSLSYKPRKLMKKCQNNDLLQTYTLFS